VSSTGEHLTPAEQHLGDRLAAFVDGELHDDARERVLAHLATCPGCKAAANDQRQLKNAVAASAPPALSAGLLARLQGLPGGDGNSGGGGDDDGGRDGVIEATSLGGQRLSGNVFGRRRAGFIPVPEPTSGFRIHEVERPGNGNASRSRRFAFAAAGAFSMAALALGGALPLDGVADGTDDPGSAVTPLSARATDAADPRSGNGTRVRSEELIGSASSASAASSVTAPASPEAGISPVVSLTRPLVLPDGGSRVTGTPSTGSGTKSSATPTTLASTATPSVAASVPIPLDSPLPLLGSASASP